MKKEIVEKLMGMRACGEAVKWTKTERTPQSAWKNCERGDWMLWLIGRTIADKPWGDERKPLVLACCECARLALKYVPGGEDRPRIAIETAEAWARGEASREEVKKAATAAADAYAAAADAAAAAADAAAADATAAAAAAYAAATAAYAAAAADAAAADAVAAAYAAADDDADDARRDTLKTCADIVRKYYPEVPTVKITGGK